MIRRLIGQRATMWLAASLAAAAAAACSGSSGNGGGGKAASNLSAVVASYDVPAGTDTRLIIGLLTPDNRFVSYGTVKMRFSFMGDKQHPQQPQFVQEATGKFLPIPGEGAANPPSRPTIGSASQGRGVYAAEPIRFDRPGLWQVEVTADLGAGDVRTAPAAFEVLAQAAVPAPGQRALATDSLTVDSQAPPAAIDSRASTEGGVPDPQLHALSIAAALKQGKPLVIVFATPVYCISRFCGPVTDMVEALQRQYGDRANFIHIEIWRDFQKQQINQAAADWLFRDGDLHEPWVFLVGRDGTILNRWDNVATSDEIVPALEKAIAS